MGGAGSRGHLAYDSTADDGGNDTTEQENGADDD
jgi:hypothetical protein